MTKKRRKMTKTRERMIKKIVKRFLPFGYAPFFYFKKVVELSGVYFKAFFDALLRDDFIVVFDNIVFEVEFFINNNIHKSFPLEYFFSKNEKNNKSKKVDRNCMNQNVQLVIV